MTTAPDSVDALPALFREALAWGKVYGEIIPTHQWDEIRESMVSQYVQRAATQVAAETWQPIETAPKDGSMLRLLVTFTENATEDEGFAPGSSATIGSNFLANTGIDEWDFAGWDWSQDCFTQGEGKPIGWMPMFDAALSAPQGAPVFVPTAEQYCAWCDRHDIENRSAFDDAASLYLTHASPSQGAAVAAEPEGVKGYAMALNNIALQLRKRYKTDLLSTPLWADFEKARNKLARSVAAPLAQQAPAVAAVQPDAAYAPLTDERIDEVVYAQCPDFDMWHEGPSIDDVRDIVRQCLAQPPAAVAAPTEGAVFRALIEFLLHTEKPTTFLRCWNEGDFEACRRDWPEAPEALYPVVQQTPAAVAAPDERETFERWAKQEARDLFWSRKDPRHIDSPRMQKAWSAWQARAAQDATKGRSEGYWSAHSASMVDELPDLATAEPKRS